MDLRCRWGALCVGLLILSAAWAGRAPEAFPRLSPNGQYAVRAETVATAVPPDIRVLWTDLQSGRVVYTTSLTAAELGTAGYIQTLAVDPRGRVWLACGAGSLDCLLILPSPMELDPVGISPACYPGLDGAERLVKSLEWLTRLAHPDGAVLLSSEEVRGLHGAEFDTGPGTDVNFPRSAAERLAAADRLRTVCLQMLAAHLERYSEVACLYEATERERPYNGFSFRQVVLPDAVRDRLRPLLPFPDGSAAPETRQAWRTKWQGLPLDERRQINRLLLSEVMLTDLRPIKVPLDRVPFAKGGFIAFTPDPFDALATDPVASVFVPVKDGQYEVLQQWERSCVVGSEGSVLWDGCVGREPAAETWTNWNAVALAEYMLDFPDRPSRYRNVLTSWVPKPLEGYHQEAVENYQEAHLRLVGYLRDFGFRNDGVDPQQTTAKALKQAGAVQAVGWFEVPAGDVFLLQSGRVLVCRKDGPPMTLADRDPLTEHQARQAWLAIDRTQFPAPPAPRPAFPEAPPFVPSTRTAINPRDGADMIYIPPGEFLMGSNDPNSGSAYPLRRTHLDGYWIYKHCVTNEQMAAFARAARLGRWPNDQAPAEAKTWDLAARYAEWAGAALPAEAQWEKAMRGTDGRPYPWGDEPATIVARQVRWETTLSPGTPYGLRFFHDYDGPSNIPGPAAEWCADRWMDEKGPGFTRDFTGTVIECHVARAVHPLQSLAMRYKHQGRLFRCAIPEGGQVTER